MSNILSGSLAHVASCISAIWKLVLGLTDPLMKVSRFITDLVGRLHKELSFEVSKHKFEVGWTSRAIVVCNSRSSSKVEGHCGHQVFSLAAPRVCQE